MNRFGKCRKRDANCDACGGQRKVLWCGSHPGRLENDGGFHFAPAISDRAAVRLFRQDCRQCWGDGYLDDKDEIYWRRLWPLKDRLLQKHGDELQRRHAEKEAANADG